MRVKLLDQEGETYVLAESQDRIAKERSMRRRRLRAYIDGLADIKARKRPLKRDALHQALGAARKDAGRDARFVKTDVQLHGAGDKQTATLTWQLDRQALRIASSSRSAPSASAFAVYSGSSKDTATWLCAARL